MPTARRLYYALEILGRPSLLEPIFLCQITAPMDIMGGVYQALNQRKGEIVEEVQIAGTPLSEVKYFFNLDQSLSPCRWIFRLHRFLERFDSRKSFPSKRVWPLGLDQGSSLWRSKSCWPRPQNQKEKRSQGGTPQAWWLSR